MDRAHADRLAFGTFRSADNATNWAHKLTASFAQPIHVNEIESGGQTLYRVSSEDLQEAAYRTVSRRADAAGVQYWRLRTVAILSISDGADGADGAEVVSQNINPPQLGGARLSPPSPVNAGSNTSDSDTSNTANTTNTTRQWDVGLQSRSFADTGDFGQDRWEASLSVEFEYYRGWGNDTHSVTLTPFVRVDSADSERTHGDIRELFYSRVGDSWDVHIGAKRVFWGVTEFHHLIDIINQTDLVENIDGEDKLGQPMVQLSLVRDWGIVEIFALAGARERTFPGADGRVRLPVKVLDDAYYESAAEDQRLDGAIRWSHFIGPFEFGLHHFSGTSRDPMLLPQASANGDIVLRQYYPVIDQTGVDAQAFYGDWAFKLEGFSRTGYGDRYAAFNVGFERTLVGVLGTRADLGIVGEYMFDERGDEAVNTYFENDIAIGGRLLLNDFADTKGLLGVVIDTQRDDYFVSLEASRRLSQSWLFSVEGRLFGGGEDLDTDNVFAVLSDPDNKTAWLQRDDYLQVEFKKFF